VAGSSERGDQPWAPINGEELLHLPGSCWLLKKTALWILFVTVVGSGYC
jgi:hypothetical protein